MRPDDWPERLAAEIEAARGRPYQMGRHDCAQWARHVTQRVSGRRLPPLPSYRSERGWQRQVRRLAPSGRLSDAVAAWLAQEPVSAKQVQRGDPVIVELRNLDTGHVREHLGVRVDARAALVGPDGLVFVPMAWATMGWRR